MNENENENETVWKETQVCPLYRGCELIVAKRKGGKVRRQEGARIRMRVKGEKNRKRKKKKKY